MKCYVLLACIVSFTSLTAQPSVTPIPAKVYVLQPIQNIAPGKAGETNLVFDGSSEVLSSQMMKHTALKAKEKYSFPKTQFREIFIIVKKGPIQFNLNNQVKTLDRGSVALLLPGDELTIFNTGTENTEFYEMSYTSKQPADMDRAKAAGPSFLMDWKDMVFKPHDKGGVRQLFDRKTAMFNRFDIHVTQLNEGNKSHDPHQHKNEEIILMLEGNAEMQIGTEHQKANPGDVVFLSSNILHNLTNIGKGACLYFAIQWN